jgi:predicted site-specific integrase-resolvase
MYDDLKFKIENNLPLTTKEAALLIGVKKNTLEVWRCQGKGPPYCKFSDAVRYMPEDCIKYRKSCLRHSTSQAA